MGLRLRIPPMQAITGRKTPIQQQGKQINSGWDARAVKMYFKTDVTNALAGWYYAFAYSGPLTFPWFQGPQVDALVIVQHLVSRRG